jgi:hypothetical protein
MLQIKLTWWRTIGFIYLAGSLSLSQAADSLGFPVLTEGQWEITNVTQLKGVAQKKSGKITHACVAPAELMKQEIAMLEKSGCKASPVVQAGGEYKYSLNCSAGRTNSYTLKTERSDEFVHITVSGEDSSVDTGRRVGECKKESGKSPKKDIQ